jgi:glycosyltransferase involved in cell wall biosynthesis
MSIDSETSRVRHHGIKRLGHTTLNGSLPQALTGVDLESVFWPPSRIGAMSAWWAHVPFAHWLVAAARPSTVVELGTHNGVSFSAFCEAMQRGRIFGRCYAIDTWKGDNHAGSYDESVFQNLDSFIRSRYSAFAELVRLTFDEALPCFENGSIDLLHVDGLHTYQAVKGDYENWRAKLSQRGIVLFHDTNVRQGDFGVWKLWTELRDQYPSFEFLHGHGLGLAAIGANLPAAITELCGLEPEAANLLRERFAQLGERWVAAHRISNLEAERKRNIQLLADHAQHVCHLETERKRDMQLLADHAQHVSNLEAERKRDMQLLADHAQHVSNLEAERKRDGQTIHLLQAQLAAIYGSRSWRITGPLRWWRTGGGDAQFRGRRTAGASDVETIEGSDLFDEAFYCARDEARIMGIKPADHYIREGEAAGLMPSPLFDPKFYADRYPDVAATGCNLLAHFIRFGRSEGRRALPAISRLSLPMSALDPNRETIVVAVHEATRTGAPILGWNIIRELKKRYNVVTLLKKGGPIEEAFGDLASATFILPDGIDFDDAETNAIARRFVQQYAPKYIVANSLETRYFVPAFERAGVPAIALVHEFSSSVRPLGTLHDLFRTASEIVFSAQLVADAAVNDYRILSARRPYKILHQGPCRLPSTSTAGKDQASNDGAAKGDLSFLPNGDGSVLVIGVGTITPRKGVEFFISAAASIARRKTACKITFAWIGQCYWFDEPYLDGLKEQIKRSWLEGSFLFPGEIEDLQQVYARADLCFLSSRLDPLPNIAIDAAVYGIPVVCFDQASGMAEILSGCDETRDLVVPYLDAEAAANRIVELAENPGEYAAASSAMKATAARCFNMACYIEAIDTLGLESARARVQADRDRDIIAQHKAFNAALCLGQPISGAAVLDPLASYLDASRRAAPRNRPRTGMLVRRPLEGFHPFIYAAENPDYDESSGEDPLAHYARTGLPKGRWQHEIIRPSLPARVQANSLRVAVHGHFHYPELFPDFLKRLQGNTTKVDLLLTTTSEDRAHTLVDILSLLSTARANVTVVPNRGRDIGPMLTALDQSELARYDVVGHFHGKRTPHVDASIGNRWRTFLWEHLVGGEHAMIDAVLAAFAADDKLGLVFPEDPHLNDWDDNLGIAEELAQRMGLEGPLPHHFDFPLGTMFWARPGALAPLLKLGLRWDDYPEEPLPMDGTLLHALERLVAFSATQAGYRYATTYVANVQR